MTPIRGQHIACLGALAPRSLARAAACVSLVIALTLSPPMWPGSNPGIALAQDGSLGVTRVVDAPVASLAGGSPINAMKRLGAGQRALLNRVGEATRGGKGKGRPSAMGRAQAVKAYQIRAVNRGVLAPGSTGTHISGKDATLQGLGQHEYLRLAGRLSGQSCETIEGGVIVRRGC